MNIHLERTRLTGAISTAAATHALGKHGEPLIMQESSELYYLIGEQTETLAPARAAHGATVSLDAGSRWTVSRTSYLTGLSLAPGARLAAPSGKRLNMTVDGRGAAIAPGSFKGQIVLAVQ
jgi:hypothetical protein